MILEETAVLPDEQEKLVWRVHVITYAISWLAENRKRPKDWRGTPRCTPASSHMHRADSLGWCILHQASASESGIVIAQA